MASGPEKRITNKILVALNALPQCRVKKRHASVMGESDLDIYGSYKGRAVFIEVKVPGEEPTKRQWKFIREWRETGAIAGYVTSTEEALALVSGFSG